VDGVALPEPEYILGVNSGPHDGAAALLRDGELVAMIEQERLSRNRHAFGEPPREAIAACLDDAGLTLDQVAEVAVGWDVPALTEIEGQPFDEDTFAQWLLGVEPGRRRPPLRYVEHHLAHAASAFYTSGFSDAAILVLDGRGERCATTLAVGGPDGIKRLRTWGTELSLGHAYGWAAEWAGLTMWGTGKLMGLAAYGAPDAPSPLVCRDDGYDIVDAPPAEALSPAHFLQLRSRMRSHFRAQYPYAAAAPGDVMAYAGLAASIQRDLEAIVIHLARLAVAETGSRSLVLAGGVALNCSASGALARSGAVDELWIPPVPFDAGVSLGAAQVADRLRHRRPAAPRLPHAQWAPTVAPEDLRERDDLAACSVSSLDPDALAEQVAEHLDRGLLVGWWSGRAEIGQRALGARSIVCDPRRRDALALLNAVKGREVWRPLAPAVLEDHVAELFDGPLPSPADFMLVAWPVRAPARSSIPAAVHVDGTARPQVVRPDAGAFHRLLTAFHARTGVPALINTSFNLAGEPIVHTADDAISAFLRSDLDVLVVADMVAVKPETQRASRAPRHPSPPRLGFTPWSDHHHS
jgi:carbamoyltransferase